jgi:hypothetical protein
MGEKAARVSGFALSGGWSVRTLSALLPATVVLGFSLLPGVAWAQPQVPATFFGSATVDGKPPEDGTEVRGFVDGQDCTQLGPGYHGTIIDAGVGAYVINVVHESQKPGCGKDGKTVAFIIGGRAAVQTAKWQLGPQPLNLTVGAGTPVPLPTATSVPTAGPTQMAATATEVAKSTPLSSGVPPTDDITLPFSTGSARQPQSQPPQASGDSGGVSVLLVVFLLVVALAAGGAVAGVLLSRRRPADRGAGPPA